MMRISFVRTQGSPDRVYVRRSDGGETSWSFPTYGDEVPHDLVHLVVEAAFGLKRGFWGRVDEGVDIARINAQANRMGGANKYAGFGEDRREILLAEAYAGTQWSSPYYTDDDRLTNLRAAYDSVGLELPVSLTFERMDQVRAKLDALRARWRALIPKGALDLTFDAAAPEASFERLGEPEDPAPAFASNPDKKAAAPSNKSR